MRVAKLVVLDSDLEADFTSNGLDLIGA